MLNNYLPRTNGKEDSMRDRKKNTQEIDEKRRIKDGKQAKEKISMKPEKRS